MKVTVTTLSGDLFVLDVGEDLELENFKAFCEIESGFPAPEISIVHNGRPLIDNAKSMKNHGVRDGDVVVLQHIATGSHNRPMSFNAPDQGIKSGGLWGAEHPRFYKKRKTKNLALASAMTHATASGRLPLPRTTAHYDTAGGNSCLGPLTGLDFSSIQVPGVGAGAGVGAVATMSPTGGRAGAGSPRMDDPAYVRDLFLANPDQLALLKQNNPRLADALATGRLDLFANVLKDQMKERERRQEQRLRMVNAHPFDTEAQRLIAEEIKQKNIEANMEAAMEYNPETFGTVVMLYINCKVNGHPVKAFIDSGAQTTIMSAACAERVNIMRLVDTRWAGIAKGVGVQRIIGRIHMVQVAIENDYLTTSFSVLEEQPMDMLLGLDMLKRHQCCIDLKNNVLRIGTTGTETHFLSERDLPECARLTSNTDDEVMETIEEKDIQKAILASRQTNPSGASTGRLDPSTSILESDKFGETEIKELVSLGFTREQVIAELRRFNGDKRQATAALFAKSLKF